MRRTETPRTWFVFRISRVSRDVEGFKVMTRQFFWALGSWRLTFRASAGDCWTRLGLVGFGALQSPNPVLNGV